MADSSEEGYIVDLQSFVISEETYNKYFGDEEWSKFDSNQFLHDYRDFIRVNDVEPLS